MKKHDNPLGALGEYVVHVGAGFAVRERPSVLAALATLGSHLGRWDADDVGIAVSLQDRRRREQRVTLRMTLPGHPPLTVTAGHPDVTRAIYGAKHDMIRELERLRDGRVRRR